MSDDIDIEEHDILDNPAIKKIFPDLSIVKEEIAKYYDDDPHIKQEPETDAYEEQSSVSAKKDIAISDQDHKPAVSVESICKLVNVSVVTDCKIDIRDSLYLDKPENIITSKCSPKHSLDVHENIKITHSLNDSIYSSSTTKDVTKYNMQRDLCTQDPKINANGHSTNPVNIQTHKLSHTQIPVWSSKIIIGTKPNPPKIATKKPNVSIPKVIIKDLGPSLTRSNRYCHECQRLFSSGKDLQDHIQNIHSIADDKESLLQKKYNCNICNKYFKSSSNLARHFKTKVHNDFAGKMKIVKTKYKKNPTYWNNPNKLLSIEPGNKSMPENIINIGDNKHDKENVCSHCKKTFTDQQSLKEHIYKVLQTESRIKSGQNIDKKSFEDRLPSSHERKKVQNRTALLDNDESKFEKLSNPMSLKSKLVFESDESSNELSDESNTASCKFIKDKCVAIENRNISDSEIKDSTTNKTIDAGLANTLNNEEKNKINVVHKRSSLNNGQYQKTDKPPMKKCKLNYNQASENKTKMKSEYVKVSGKATTKGEKEYLNQSKTLDSKHTENNNGRMIYECIYCTYMSLTARAYYMHVIDKHNIETISKLNKVEFNGQCKYCSYVHNNVAAHNAHLHSCHSDILHEILVDASEDDEQNQTHNQNTLFKKENSFALKSTIFKCGRCDIIFLSSSLAQNHSTHMEILVNWKCPQCALIFKKQDKELHLKQHEVSDKINVRQFNDSELSSLLYCCTKCTLHYTEYNYMEHYRECDYKKNESLYCNICDILIDKSEFETHKIKHKIISEFAIIAEDIIMLDNENIKTTNEKYHKGNHKKINYLTFCKTCKCYLSDLAATRKAHVESRCANIPKFVCNKCGLIFTNVSIRKHRNQHKLNSNLSLNDFKFYDFKGRQIKPPIPEYPRCRNCKVHFINKSVVKYHICSELVHITCAVCMLKFSENAFQLHMKFHDYTKAEVKKKMTITLSNEQSQKSYCHGKLEELELDKTSKEVFTDNEPIKNIHKYMYSCKCCNIGLNSYEEVIEHCQSHYHPAPKDDTFLKSCSICSLKFKSEAYEVHQNLHSCKSTYKLLTFDPVYFVSDNDTWTRHIFRAISQVEQKEILKGSIYQAERRIKMEVVQKGPCDLTIYKCDKCGNIIDPEGLLTHVKNCIGSVAKRYPCTTCGLPFMSITLRKQHKQIHDQHENIRAKSYNIVLINSEIHNTHNKCMFNATKQYILYQCRSCDGIVDKLLRYSHQCNTNNLKKCLHCELLLYKDDYDQHVSKHKNLPRFKSKNIKVILFGQIDETQKKKLLPSFSGMVFDYTLYKCINCEVHIKNLSTALKHVCIFDDTKCKCSKCGLVLAQRHIKGHLEMHTLDPDYNIKNIKIIMFDLKKGKFNIISPNSRSKRKKT